ncbi:hypothetical protein JOD55_000200 [Arcanobacterium pluranimalium]|uniref:hypothetical protein n=1 Tax=Arcanobacterium pluranimalium TaxID=108028 RepID=UPI001957C9BF|nr:hypothetical protein [Arcanobacterium pluranimalium]MBM7824373.1 hypothetical protein [Arcanobacterium pluranimalium]
MKVQLISTSVEYDVVLIQKTWKNTYFYLASYSDDARLVPYGSRVPQRQVRVLDPAQPNWVSPRKIRGYLGTITTDERLISYLEREPYFLRSLREGVRGPVEIINLIFASDDTALSILNDKRDVSGLLVSQQQVERYVRSEMRALISRMSETDCNCRFVDDVVRFSQDNWWLSLRNDSIVGYELMVHVQEGDKSVGLWVNEDTDAYPLFEADEAWRTLMFVDAAKIVVDALFNGEIYSGAVAGKSYLAVPAGEDDLYIVCEGELKRRRQTLTMTNTTKWTRDQVVEMLVPIQVK